MDAVNFIREQSRMCEYYEMYCSECPIGRGKEIYPETGCQGFIKECPQKAVSLVEEWSEKYPKKTNFDKFLEVFGNPLDFVTTVGFWQQEYRPPEE